MWGHPPGELVHKKQRLPAAEYQAILERRRVMRARYPEHNCPYIPTCGYCGLRWHEEDNEDGTPQCDLKKRRMGMSFIGSALAEVI